MPEVEISFPRGGTREVYQRGTYKPKRDDNLFKISTDNKISEKKRKKKPQRKAKKKAKEEEDVKADLVIESLTFQTLNVGMITLACVVEVREFEVKVVLPGGLLGKVPIINISQPYTSLLTAYAEDPDNVVENVITLRAMFSAGETVPCKVISKSQDPVSLKRSITVSLNPKDVNEGIHPSVLYHGMVLYSAVSSIEDHGYVMDIGIKGLQAFLNNNDASSFIQSKNNGRPLAVGQLVPSAVNMPHLKANDSLEGRTVLLTAKPKVISQMEITENRKVTLHTLLPGMTISAVIEEVKEEGLIVKCLNFPGCVLKNNLKNIWDVPSKYIIGQEVTGYILYIHPITKVIYLSFAPKPSPQNIAKKFGKFKITDIIEDATVVGVERGCIYLKINESTKAIATKSHLSDEDIENVREAFSVGQTCRCRIFSFDYFECMVRVSLKEHILKNKYIPLEDLKVGALFEGKVVKFEKSGAVVKLAQGIHGFVRNIHVSDVPIVHPEKIFLPGKEIRCQILQVDINSFPLNLQLTCKKSLIGSKLPILSSYEEASPGLITDGVVVLINEQGLLVTFYNGVQGWVPSKDLGASRIQYPEKIFYVGQVVKCQVTLCIPHDKILKLSLKIQGRRPFGMKEMGEKKFEAGKMVTVKVKSKSASGLDVEIIPSHLAAFLPQNHLSDHPGNCQLLLDTYKKNDEISDVLCFNSKGIAMVSKKTSLIDAARNGSLKYHFSDVEENITLPVVVKGFAMYGMFVETTNGLSGLVPKRLMIDGKVNNPFDVGYLLQQSLTAKITKIDHDNQRLEFSTKLSDLYFRETTSGLDLLQDFLTDQERIIKYYINQRGIKAKLTQIICGDLVTVKTTSIENNGCMFDLENGVKGFAKKFHCGDKELELQSSHTAVVLYVDLLHEVVELSLLPNIVKSVKNMKDTDSSQVRLGQVIKCQALLIKYDFVLVMLGGHAVGRFAYLPTRRHLNDIWGRKRLYSLGEYYHLVVKRIYNKYVLGALKQHCKRDVEQSQVECLPSQVKRKAEEEVTNKKQKKKKTEEKLNSEISQNGALKQHCKRDVEPSQVECVPSKIKRKAEEKVTNKKEKKKTKEKPNSEMKKEKNGEISQNGALKQYCKRDAEPSQVECVPSKVKRKAEEKATNKREKKKKSKEKLNSEMKKKKNGEISKKLNTTSDDHLQFESKNDNIQQNTSILSGVRRISDGDVNDELILEELNLTLGKQYSAVIKKVKRFQLNIVINNDIPGRVRVTEASTEGSNPLKKFSAGQQINVYLIGLHHSKAGLPIIHQRILLECSLCHSSVRKNKLDIPYAAGQGITGLVNKEVENDSIEEHIEAPRLNVSEGFQWHFEGAPNQLAQEASSSDSDESGEVSKKSKKEKKERDKKEEEHLFKTERLLMDNEREPETVNDFDRLVLASPNSSIIWLRYMAFHLQQAEIDKARAVAERALKTILFREEQEKLNVWMALLNLENLYGTKDSLDGVFQRAIQFNEPLKVYNHLARIYVSSNKLEEAEKLYSNMVRRFRQIKQVWVDFGEFYLKSGKSDSAHKLMQRGLKSLDKKEHIEVISKFGQMEYKHGDPERGKTMFESVLNNYPKRTDLWSVYIDMTLKQGDIEAVRQIFERVITLTLSAKKMKFFFKKYLDVEMKYGNEETVNDVKEKALRYVESITTVDSHGS